MLFDLFKRKKAGVLDEHLYPKWEPDIPIDYPTIVDRMQYYCNSRYRFVLFANGTCAFVRNDSATPASDAIELLRRAAFGHVDFNPRLMDDGNYLVGFGERVCGVVLARELKDHATHIAEHHLEGVRKDEVFFNSGAAASSFDDRGRAGLLARARMFMDSKRLTVAQVCEPAR